MLSEQQLLALELLIKNYNKKGQKKTTEQIAKEVGVSRQTLSRWMNHDEEFIEKYKEFVNAAIRTSVAAAQHTMVSLLHADDEKVRLGAAKDILDRAGFETVTDINVTGNIPVVIAGVDSIEQ